MMPEYRRVWEACSRDPQIFQVVPAGPEHGDADEENGDDDDESSALKGTGGIIAVAALAGVVMAGMLY